jgi:hypothetical protein
MSVSNIRLYQILKERLGEKEAELGCLVNTEIKNEFDSRKKIFATKEDSGIVKTELIKSIYFIGLIQFLAITGAMIGIVNFTIK